MMVFGVVRLLTQLEPLQLKMGSVTDAFHIAFQKKTESPPLPLPAELNSRKEESKRRETAAGFITVQAT
jgi:hypothetical protein